MPTVHLFTPIHPRLRQRGLRRVLWVMCLGWLACWIPTLARADQSAVDPAPLSGLVSQWLQGQTQVQLPQQVQTHAGQAQPGVAPRVEVALVDLDPRLKPAPCQKMDT